MADTNIRRGRHGGDPLRDFSTWLEMTARELTLAAHRFTLLVRLMLHRDLGWWVVALIIFPGVQSARFMWTRDIQCWTELDGAVLRAVIQMTPLILAFGVMVGSRDRRYETGELVGTVALSSLRIWFRRWTSVAVVALLMWCVLIGIALMLGVTRATWGGPDIRMWLPEIHWLVTWAGFGTAIGTVLPKGYVLMGVLLLVAATFVTIGQASMSAWYVFSFADVLSWLPDGGALRLRGIVPADRADWLAWIIATVALLTTCGAIVARKNAGKARNIVLAGSLSLVVGAVIIARPVTDISYTPSFIPNNELVCAGTSPEICVHPALAKMLPALERDSRIVLAPLAGIQGVSGPDRVVQIFCCPPGGSDQDFLEYKKSIQPASVWMLQTGSGGHPYQLSRFQVAQLMVWNEPSGGNQASSVVAAWLALSAGDTPDADEQLALFMNERGYPGTPSDLKQFQIDQRAALDRFLALPDDERDSWLSANWDNLRAGRIQLEQMP